MQIVDMNHVKSKNIDPYNFSNINLHLIFNSGHFVRRVKYSISFSSFSFKMHFSLSKYIVAIVITSWVSVEIHMHLSHFPI